MNFDRRLDPNQKSIPTADGEGLLLSPAAVLAISLKYAYAPADCDASSGSSASENEQGRGRARHLVALLMQSCIDGGMPYFLSDQLRGRAAMCLESDPELLHLSRQAVGFLTQRQFRDAMAEAGMPTRNI